MLPTSALGANPLRDRGGHQRFFDGATTSEVIVASGANYPDVLVAGPIAAQLGIPILLATPYTLPASTAAELDRL